MCTRMVHSWSQAAPSMHNTCNKRWLLIPITHSATSRAGIVPSSAAALQSCDCGRLRCSLQLEPGPHRTRTESPKTDRFFTSGCGTVAGSSNDLDVAGETLGAVQWDRLEFQVITFKLCDHRQVTSPCSTSSFLFSYRGTLHHLQPCRWKH